MKKALREFVRDESGSVLIYVTVTIGVLLMLTSLSVNFSYRHFSLNRIQITADAAALAGASQLPNAASVAAQANAYAEHNMPSAHFQDVLADPDIQLGNWDANARQFDPTGTPLNAVRVVVRRSTANTANSNPLQLFMPAVLGAPATADLEAEAIAWATVSSCFSNGYVAKGTVGKIVSGSQNTYAGYCMHGQNGVDVGSQNVFEAGSQISMQDLDDLQQGSDNFGLNEALKEADNEPSAADQIDTLLENFENLTGPFPSYLDAATPININGSYSGPWTTGKLYIVDGDVEIKTSISNVGIYSTTIIKVDSNLTLQNVFMASEDKVEMGSNIQLGAIPYGSEETPPDPSGCASISGAVFIAAKNLVKLGSNLSMSGVQVISGGDYEVGSENKIHGAVGVQAAGLIKFGSEEQYQGCNTSNEHILIPAGGTTLRLVN